VTPFSMSIDNIEPPQSLVRWDPNSFHGWTAPILSILAWESQGQNVFVSGVWYPNTKSTVIITSGTPEKGLKMSVLSYCFSLLSEPDILFPDTQIAPKRMRYSPKGKGCYS